MSDQRGGGIGSGRAVVELPEDAVDPPEEAREVADVAEAPGLLRKLREASDGQSAAIEALGPSLQTLRDEIARVGSESRQLGVQLAQLEQAVQNINSWAQGVEARLAALAQQLMSNIRVTALKLATDSRYTGESKTHVISNAEAYLQFIAPPPPEPPLPGEQTPPAEKPPGETTH